MYPMQVAGNQHRRSRPVEPHRSPSSALPQPLLRLTAMGSIGIGAGLFSASAPTEVLILTFAPALVAMAVIAVQSIFGMPEPAPVEEVPTEVTHG